MNELYIRDTTPRVNELKSKIDAQKSLQQREIIEYSNHLTYELHRTNDQEIKASIVRLYQSNIKYLDLSEREFITSFPAHYMQRIFELVMANFIANKFELLDRDVNKEVEFSFTANNKKYYLECVTRNAGQMDKFYQFLPHSESYFQIAKIIFEAHTRWAKKYNITNSEWYFNIDLRWHDSLHSHEKVKIIEILQKMKIKDDNNKFQHINNWIYYNRYACLLYKNLIPSNLWQRFSDISFPTGSLCGEVISINEYALNSIVQVLIGKLKKSYFSVGEPVILAISLSNFAEFMYFEPMEGFIQYIEKNICSKLTDAINKNEDKDILKSNIKNLYALLIDTNSYNWFPKIAKERYGAIFTDHTPNYYGIVYNTNLGDHLEQYRTQRIFNSVIPFTIEQSLGI